MNYWSEYRVLSGLLDYVADLTINVPGLDIDVPGLAYDVQGLTSEVPGLTQPNLSTGVEKSQPAPILGIRFPSTPSRNNGIFLRWHRFME